MVKIECERELAEFIAVADVVRWNCPDLKRLSISSHLGACVLGRGFLLIEISGSDTSLDSRTSAPSWSLRLQQTARWCRWSVGKMVDSEECVATTTHWPQFGMLSDFQLVRFTMG